MIAAPATAERRTAAKAPTLPVIFKAETAALGLVVGAAALLVAELGAVLVAGVLADKVVPNPELTGVVVERVIREVTADVTVLTEAEPEEDLVLELEVVLLAPVIDATLVAPLGPIENCPVVERTCVMFETPTASRE